VNKRRKDEQACMISLNPVQKVFAGHPTYLNWKYSDSQGVFYPPNVDLLIIVSKSTVSATKHEVWFPFELRLEWELKVDVHGLWGSIIRLVHRADKHDGWCFKIRGQYKPSIAKDALEDARGALKDGYIPSVGLRAAVKPWMIAQKKGESRVHST